MAVVSVRPTTPDNARQKRHLLGTSMGIVKTVAMFLEPQQWAKLADEEDDLEPVSYRSRILPRKLRFLAVITGCVVGIALMSYRWLSLSAIPLILGAVFQPRVPRAEGCCSPWLLHY
jgi:hypothetical protein